MTPLLHAAREAREHRDYAEGDFRRALVAAHDAGSSVRTIATAVGMSSSAVHYLIRKERNDG